MKPAANHGNTVKISNPDNIGTNTKLSERTRGTCPNRLREHNIAEPPAHSTDRDRHIALDCYEHHVLRTDQLKRLHFTGLRTASARLGLLYELRVLDRFRPTPDEARAPCPTTGYSMTQAHFFVVKLYRQGARKDLYLVQGSSVPTPRHLDQIRSKDIRPPARGFGPCAQKTSQWQRIIPSRASTEDGLSDARDTYGRSPGGQDSPPDPRSRRPTGPLCQDLEISAGVCSDRGPQRPRRTEQ